MIGPHLLTLPIIRFMQNHKFFVIKDIANIYISSPPFTHWKDATELEILDPLILKWKLYITKRRQIYLVWWLIAGKGNFSTDISDNHPTRQTYFVFLLACLVLEMEFSSETQVFFLVGGTQLDPW